MAGGLIYTWFYFTAITKIWFPLLYSFLDALYFGFIRDTPAENVNGEYWRQWVTAFYGNIQEAFIEFEQVLDEETGVYIGTDEVDAAGTLMRTIIPFNYFGDDILNFFDYVTAGRPKQYFEDRINTTRRRFENSGVRTTLEDLGIIGTTTGGTTTGGTTTGGTTDLGRGN